MAVKPEYLPVYIVLDSSASMTIDNAWNEAIKFLPSIGDEMTKNPVVGDKLRVELITFDEDARVVISLGDRTAIERWCKESMNDIEPTGESTQYGKAFGLLSGEIERGVGQLLADGAKVFRPVVIFLTDGKPVGETQEERDDAFAPLADFSNKYHPNIVCVGFGDASKEFLLPYCIGRPKEGTYRTDYAFHLLMPKDGVGAGELLPPLIKTFVLSILESFTKGQESSDSPVEEVEDNFNLASAMGADVHALVQGFSK